MPDLRLSRPALWHSRPAERGRGATWDERPPRRRRQPRPGLSAHGAAAGWDDRHRLLVVLDGLIATNSYHHGIRIESVSNVTVKNCVAYYSGGRAGDNSAGIGVLYSNSNNVTVKACSTYSIYSYPFSPSTYDINTDGICVYRCRECTIDSNVVFDIAPGAPAIRMKWLDTLCTVSNNTIFNCSDGISVGPQCSQNSVYGNIIFDLAWDGITLKGTNNLGDNNATRVYNNTLYNCGNGGIKTYPENIVRDASIWNNLVINSHAGSGAVNYNLTTEANNHTNLYSDYNCYLNTNTSIIANWVGASYTLAQLRTNANIDLNSVNVNPVFADTANHDFRLTSNSPACGQNWRPRRTMANIYGRY